MHEFMHFHVIDKRAKLKLNIIAKDGIYSLRHGFCTSSYFSRDGSIAQPRPCSTAIFWYHSICLFSCICTHLAFTYTKTHTHTHTRTRHPSAYTFATHDGASIGLRDSANTLRFFAAKPRCFTTDSDAQSAEKPESETAATEEASADAEDSETNSESEVNEAAGEKDPEKIIEEVRGVDKNISPLFQPW